MKKEEVMGAEESLKTTADALKKQLKDEAHARTVLQVSQAYTAYFMLCYFALRCVALHRTLRCVALRH